uniref:Uncharacterized protein n=1 Tax=Lutzomyia longipalpis TaxID=7200 RepID=A0A1B0EWW5_LUTLO
MPCHSHSANGSPELQLLRLLASHASPITSLRAVARNRRFPRRPPHLPHILFFGAAAVAGQPRFPYDIIELCGAESALSTTSIIVVLEDQTVLHDGPQWDSPLSGKKRPKKSQILLACTRDSEPLFLAVHVQHWSW